MRSLLQGMRLPSHADSYILVRTAASGRSALVVQTRRTEAPLAPNQRLFSECACYWGICAVGVLGPTGVAEQRSVRSRIVASLLVSF